VKRGRGHGADSRAAANGRVKGDNSVGSEFRQLCTAKLRIEAHGFKERDNIS